MTAVAPLAKTAGNRFFLSFFFLSQAPNRLCNNHFLFLPFLLSCTTTVSLTTSRCCVNGAQRSNIYNYSLSVRPGIIVSKIERIQMKHMQQTSYYTIHSVLDENGIAISREIMGLERRACHVGVIISEWNRGAFFFSSSFKASKPLHYHEIIEFPFFSLFDVSLWSVLEWPYYYPAKRSGSNRAGNIWKRGTRQTVSSNDMNKGFCFSPMEKK